MYYQHLQNNWGEPEQAPHRRVSYEFSFYIYICRTSCHKSLLALSCLLLLHSLIQKLFTNYLARRHELYLLDGEGKDGDHSWTYLFNGLSNRPSLYRLLHGKNISSVNAIICVATHSGSHSSHGPTSPMATLMRAIACHKRWQECFIYPYHLSVDIPCKTYGVLDQCVCSNRTDWA